MRLSDFDYHLPEQLIAQAPIEPRDASRLLVVNRATGELTHAHFYDLAAFLQPGDLLVRNNTKVIPARFFAKKDTGGTVEILLNKKVTDQPNATTWEVLTRPGLKPGQVVRCTDARGTLLSTGRCDGMGADGYTRMVTFDLAYPRFLEALAVIGQTPLPPYIHTTDAQQWATRYQTLYAKHPGSAASPTAGLHMTPELEGKLLEKGVEIAEVTLHVGLGTFLPVKTDDVTQHHMHSEQFVLHETTASSINQAKAKGRRVIAVGTTTTRVLESCADAHGLLTAQSGETSIYIYPPYQFRCIDGLITNFHLPKSTLLMLVSALVSTPNTQQSFTMFKDTTVGKAYEVAVQEKYRFFSFGDAMLIN